jgi:hypothetical protein
MNAQTASLSVSRGAAACALLLGFASMASAASSLITNGSFEAGNTGFTSAYTYVSPGPGALNPGAVYTVDTNPANSHGLFFNMGDHTTGSGMMMIVNGSSVTGIPVWQGTATAPLVIGQQYDFSAWVASVHPTSPAQLTFSVSGVNIGTLSPPSNGTWTRLFGTFTAGQTNPTFLLLNANPALSGNDFAIDDIDIFLPGTTINPPPSGVPDSGDGVVGALAILGLIAAARRAITR